MKTYQVSARTMKNLPMARYQAETPEEALAIHVAATATSPEWLAVPAYAAERGPRIDEITTQQIAREAEAARIRAANAKVDMAERCSGERGKFDRW